jgi:dCMP deaminase
MSKISWEKYALELAGVASARSEDPYEKVGACVLRHDHSVAGMGYNGAPKGVEIDWSNRDERRCRVIHAEVNALRYARPDECYLLASSMLPCNYCLRMAASYGIRKIVFSRFYGRDDSSLSLSKEFGIDLHHYGD